MTTLRGTQREWLPLWIGAILSAVLGLVVMAQFGCPSSVWSYEPHSVWTQPIAGDATTNSIQP